MRKGVVKRKMADYSKEEIMRLVGDEDVEFIRLQFTDMQGILKNVAIPARRLSDAMDGTCAIDLALLEGAGRGETKTFYLKPELSTFAILPWRPQQGKVARFLCDICYADGREYEGSPRYILKRVAADMEKTGYSLLVNPECEFFLFHTDDNGQPTTLSHEQATYLDTSPVDLGENTRRDIILAMEDMGYEIASSHHETAPAQHEIDFTYENALATADKLMTFKVAARTIARRYGLHATFMPKPRADADGSGMHLNLRLMKDGKNVLTDENGLLSQGGRAFLAGILRHLPGVTAMLNPVVNSYKRLIPEFEADWEPSRTDWRGNALICIRKDTSEIELKTPDGAANPYLVFALCMAAGMDGINGCTQPCSTQSCCAQQPCGDDFFKALSDAPEGGAGEVRIGWESAALPENLGEALLAMQNDRLVCDTLGAGLYGRYLKAKRKEWKEYLEQVSEWEQDRYLYLV